MKAAIYRKYGPPEVVQFAEIPKPEPKENEILIKVYASTVNRTDSGFRSAEYFISRFWSGLFKPKFPVLGCEFSGIIEKIGSKVTTFSEGDRVFGFNDRKFGGHAAYLTIQESDAVATIPEHLNFQEAAAMTEGSHYALLDIRAARVKPGHKVMVYGATGAIGSAAVQILKHFNAIVTAVGNTKNIPLLKSLGADNVIDYQTQDFTQTSERYDFIFDAVGKSSFIQCKPLLKPTGIYISTELGKRGVNLLYAIISKFTKGEKLLFPLPTISKDDVLLLKSLSEHGKFKPVIDCSYSLDQIVEAYKYVETGQKTGNVIIKIIE